MTDKSDDTVALGVVAIVGSRDYPDLDDVSRAVERLTERGPVQIISGGARGVDRRVREACRDLDFHFCQEDPDPHDLDHLPLPYHFFEFLPKTKSVGALFARNSEIVRHASMVIAFFAPGPRTHGTSDTVEKAIAAHLPTYIYHEGRWHKEWPLA